MPNKYIYRRMKMPETQEKMRAAHLSKSDAIKLFGRHFAEVTDYLDPAKPENNPTTPEMLILDYLAEYPEAAPIMLDMAEVRITGQRSPRE